MATELSITKDRVKGLETSAEGLNQRLWETGVAVSDGTLTPRNTVILQMQANPASEHFALRRQELDRIKGENTALLGRIHQLETGAGGEGGELVPRESWESANAEKEELLRAVAQKELRLLRLKQVSHLQSLRLF